MSIFLYHSPFKIPGMQNVQLLKNNLENHIVQSIQPVSRVLNSVSYES